MERNWQVKAENLIICRIFAINISKSEQMSDINARTGNTSRYVGG